MVTHLGALLVLLLVPSAARQEIIDRVLASVDSAIIAQSDVLAVMRLGLVNASGAPDPVAFTLERLIERRLTLNEVERYVPAEPADAEIARRFEAVTSPFPPDRLEAILAESGLTRESLRRYVRDDLRIQAYLEQRFGGATQPSDDEILQYYEAHKAAFTSGGVTRPFDEVREAARDAFILERRNTMVREWLAGVRKRANVNVLPRSPR